MSKQAGAGQNPASWCPWRARLSPVLVLLAVACNTRDRLTFPDPSDGIGPATTIDRPNGSDTTVAAGGDFVVQGRTVDLDGVDTVYFLVIGGNQHFNPFVPSQPTDTVRWGLPLSTTGRSGSTITVQVYGVDIQGNHGAPSTRQVIVQ
jgi:hypothetical protein